MSQKDTGWIAQLIIMVVLIAAAYEYTYPGEIMGIYGEWMEWANSLLAIPTTMMVIPAAVPGDIMETLYTVAGAFVGVLAVGLWWFRNNSPTATLALPSPLFRGKGATVPANVYAATAGVLKNRGGQSDGKQNFYPIQADSFETPLMYSIRVGFQPTADIAKLATLELALEEELYPVCGDNVRVRVGYMPTRIEIDKPKPKPLLLADRWDEIKRKSPTNTRVVMPGMLAGGRELSLAKIELANDRFASFIVANSGYGKTQLAMSQILTLAMTHSPERMSMIICDPKGDDWMPFDLPHLAMPVVVDAEELLATVAMLIDEMEARRKRSIAGDRTYKEKTILLYIDELSDVFSALPQERRKEMAAMLQRLTQRGRSAGFIIIAATQRMHDLKGYAEAYSKLQLRYAGNTTSNGDAAAVVGPGASLSKLRKGAFEIHADGPTRMLQGFFVADAGSPTYAADIAKFTRDIKGRWGRNRPHFTIDREDIGDLLLEAGLADDDNHDSNGSNDDAGSNVVEIAGSFFPHEFIDAVQEESGEGQGVTAYRIGKIYESMYSRELNKRRRNKVAAYLRTSEEAGPEGVAQGAA